MLYRTRFGLGLMERFSKVKILDYLAFAGIIAGFTGMLGIFVLLAVETFKLVTVPGTQPALAPVLPGVEISGAPALSFWHWIIVILIAAAIHEFSHGVLARRFGVPIKSSGFAFLGPIIAAFVEPDEAHLLRIRKRKQIAIFSMGPFANIVFGIIVFLILSFGMQAAGFQAKGVIVNEVMEGYPIEKLDISVPFIITKVNENEVNEFEDFVNATKNIKPGDKVQIGISGVDNIFRIYEITAAANPQNASKGFFGIAGLELKIVSSRFGNVEGVLP